MPNVSSVLSSEISTFIAAKDKREFLITRAEKLFDQAIAPIDLPGPDQMIDPLLRAAIRPVIGRLYDEVIEKLEEVAHAG